MDATTDAELVARITGGEPGAFATLYDRYADRIHDLCLHLLRDRHDAADATAEVFLAAADHLDQLRDPSRLRSWLYAIARNEVYRRTRSRKRETLMDASDFAEVPDIDLRDDQPDPAAMVGLVREAALGLDERDRMVMELTLAGGLDGRDLGDALGLGENAAHQAAHRMRERLGRSIGALLVARQGRDDCDDLAELLGSWDGTFSVLWRKRVARHVDGCEVCDEHRRGVPAAILGGSAFAAPLPVRFVGPPDRVREQVLGQVATHGVGAAGRRRKGWHADGFPPAPGVAERRRVVLGAVAAAIVLVVGIAGIGSALGSDDPQEVAVRGLTATASTTTADVVAGPGAPSTSAGPDESTSSIDPSQVTALAATGSTLPGTSPTTTRPRRSPRPTAIAPPATTASTAPPNRAPTTTAAPATTTTAPMRPTLDVAVPPDLHAAGECPPNPDIVATVTPNVGSVSMQWTLVTPNGTSNGTQFLTKQAPDRWTVSWQPASAGRYSLVFSGTAPGATGGVVTVTATETVSVAVCIR